MIVWLVLFLISCSDSQRRKEGVAELQRVQSVIHKMDIVVSVGVTKQEYSQRLADALIKVGDLERSAKQTTPKFPTGDQAIVEQIYAHLVKALEPYKIATEFFGDKHVSEDIWESTLYQDEYEPVKNLFTTLDVPVEEEVKAFSDGAGPAQPYDRRWYNRWDMVRALWRVGAEEDAKAKQLIDQLNQK